MQKTPDVRYSSKETGKLILEGFPGTIEFLALLWAQFRKEFLNKRYEVGATAIFKNNEDSIIQAIKAIKEDVEKGKTYEAVSAFKPENVIKSILTE